MKDHIIEAESINQIFKDFPDNKGDFEESNDFLIELVSSRKLKTAKFFRSPTKSEESIKSAIKDNLGIPANEKDYFETVRRLSKEEEEFREVLKNVKTNDEDKMIELMNMEKENKLKNAVNDQNHESKLEASFDGKKNFDFLNNYTDDNRSVNSIYRREFDNDLESDISTISNNVRAINQNFVIKNSSTVNNDNKKSNPSDKAFVEIPINDDKLPNQNNQDNPILERVQIKTQESTRFNASLKAKLSHKEIENKPEIVQIPVKNKENSSLEIKETLENVSKNRELSQQVSVEAKYKQSENKRLLSNDNNDKTSSKSPQSRSKTPKRKSSKNLNGPIFSKLMKMNKN